MNFDFSKLKDEPEVMAFLPTILREGFKPAKDCEHIRQTEAGYGTATFFMDCIDCGAHLAFGTGDDPYLRALESSREP